MARAKKRKDGLYQRVFTYEGKRYCVYGRSLTDLNEKEAEKREMLSKKMDIRKNPTTREYFDKWIDNRRGEVSESTIASQNKSFNVIARAYIESACRTFGELKVRDVSADDIKELQKELRKPYTIKTKAGEEIQKQRNTQCVNDYIALVKHIFKTAADERIIEFNPCNTIKNLKRVEEAARDTNHRALTIEEAEAFFNCERCKNSFYYDAFRLSYLTGMRVGEIGALKYSDIKDGFINIQRTVTRAETGGYMIGKDAKTKAGKRTIKINEKIAEVLEHQRNINMILDGNVINLNDCIFKSVERGIFLATPADREIKRICKAAGIEDFTFHAFRDSFATRAIESDINPKTLQEIMGHANFNLTMSLYGHCTDETKTKAMNTLNDVFAI